MVAIIPFSILEFQVECNFIVISLNVKRNWQTKRASQYLSPEGGESWTIFFFWGGGGGTVVANAVQRGAYFPRNLPPINYQ